MKVSWECWKSMTNEQLVVRIQAGEETAVNMLQLWQQNKGFVASIAKKYRGYAEMEDLMQEGYIGLNDAVEHYKEGKGALFASYAAFWIRSRIRRYVEQSGTIRLPSHEYTAVLQYKRFVREYTQEYGCKPSYSLCRAYLGIDAEKLEQLRKAESTGEIKSLDAAIGEEDDSYTLGDTIASDQNLEGDVIRKRDHELMSEELWKMIDDLPENQAIVITRRYKNKDTYEVLGRELGCSFQYARDLERTALRKLRGPARKIKCRLYFEQYIAPAEIHHVGVESFQRNWMSSVDRDALRDIEAWEHEKELREAQEIRNLLEEWAGKTNRTEDKEASERFKEQRYVDY